MWVPVTTARCLQGVYGGDGLQIWRVVANVLNERHPTRGGQMANSSP